MQESRITERNITQDLSYSGKDYMIRNKISTLAEISETYLLKGPNKDEKGTTLDRITKEELLAQGEIRPETKREIVLEEIGKSIIGGVRQEIRRTAGKVVSYVEQQNEYVMRNPPIYD